MHFLDKQFAGDSRETMSMSLQTKVERAGGQSPGHCGGSRKEGTISKGAGPCMSMLRLLNGPVLQNHIVHYERLQHVQINIYL